MNIGRVTHYCLPQHDATGTTTSSRSPKAAQNVSSPIPIQLCTVCLSLYLTMILQMLLFTFHYSSLHGAMAVAISLSAADGDLS